MARVLLVACSFLPPQVQREASLFQSEALKFLELMSVKYSRQPSMMLRESIKQILETTVPSH